MSILDAIGRNLARYLAKPRADGMSMASSTPDVLAKTLQKGDILLVEGSSRFSSAIKYLTQSSWSHAAMYIGEETFPSIAGEEPHVLVDADVVDGVRSLPLSEFSTSNTRICRPVGLEPAEIDAVVAYAIARIGHQYNLKNIIDLARYLVQTPPVGSARRRRMLAFCSGDPTRAICSTLIAQAFQCVRYPILPDIILEKSRDPSCAGCHQEMLHIRHHSLFAPRDFDVSPYFMVVKPTLQFGFDPHSLNWEEAPHNGKEQVLCR